VFNGSGGDLPDFRAGPPALLGHHEVISYFLTFGQYCPNIAIMKGNEFIKRIRKLAKERGLFFQLDAARGKGSHITLYLGDKLTIVRNPKDELKTGTFHGTLKQLGVDPEEL